MPTTLTVTFISLLFVTTLARIWLGRRHFSYVQKHRNQVPAAFSSNITLDAHQKAADYTAAKTKLAMVEVVVQAVLLVWLTLGGGLQWIDDSWRHLDVYKRQASSMTLPCNPCQ